MFLLVPVNSGQPVCLWLSMHVDGATCHQFQPLPANSGRMPAHTRRESRNSTCGPVS